MARSGAVPGGFSLVEALIATFMIAVAALVLLPVTLNVALQSRRATVEGQLTAALGAEAEQVSMTDFDELEPGTKCFDFSNSHFPHTKCITVVELDSNRKRVTVIITPHDPHGVGPDTVVIERARRGRYNPLNP